MGRPIAFLPELARKLGGIEEALFYQQLHYWSDKGNREDGFIYKTIKEIEEETTLTRRQQDRVRLKLIKEGWLDVKKIHSPKGVPTLHYKCLVEFSISTKRTNGNVQNVQMHLHERYKCSTTESTTESTTIAAKPQGPFDWGQYLQAMDNHKSRHVQVVAFYFRKKGLKFDTLKKAQTAIRRHLRSAKEVANFDDHEIVEAYKTADREYKERYTIETLLKILTR